jgi:hypothetical protein
MTMVTYGKTFYSEGWEDLGVKCQGIDLDSLFPEIPVFTPFKANDWFSTSLWIFNLSAAWNTSKPQSYKWLYACNKVIFFLLKNTERLQIVSDYNPTIFMLSSTTVHMWAAHQLTERKWGYIFQKMGRLGESTTFILIIQGDHAFTFIQTAVTAYYHGKFIEVPVLSRTF